MSVTASNSITQTTVPSPGLDEEPAASMGDSDMPGNPESATDSSAATGAAQPERSAHQGARTLRSLGEQITRQQHQAATTTSTPEHVKKVSVSVSTKGLSLKISTDHGSVTSSAQGLQARPALAGKVPEAHRDPQQRLAPAEALKPGEGASGMLRKVDEVNANRGRLPLMYGKITAELFGKKKELAKIGTEGSGDARDGWVSSSRGAVVKAEVGINVKNTVENALTGVAAKFTRFIVEHLGGKVDAAARQTQLDKQITEAGG